MAMSTMPAFEIRNPDFKAAVVASFARQGLLGQIGAWLQEVAPGKIVIELPYSSRVGQQTGLFHGGVIGAIADSAGGYAALSLMPARSEVVTVEYKINFVRPARGPMIRATGEVLRSGKSITVCRVDVMVHAGPAPELCAAMQASFMRVEV